MVGGALRSPSRPIRPGPRPAGCVAQHPPPLKPHFPHPQKTPPMPARPQAPAAPPSTHVGVVAAAEKLAVDEHARHAPAARQLQQRVLDGLAVVARVELHHRQLVGGEADAGQRRLGCATRGRAPGNRGWSWGRQGHARPGHGAGVARPMQAIWRGPARPGPGPANAWSGNCTPRCPPGPPPLACCNDPAHPSCSRGSTSC